MLRRHDGSVSHGNVGGGYSLLLNACCWVPIKLCHPILIIDNSKQLLLQHKKKLHQNQHIPIQKVEYYREQPIIEVDDQQTPEI